MPVDPLATRCPHCTSRLITRDEITLTLGMLSFGVAAMVVYSYKAAILACVAAGALCAFGAYMLYKFARSMLSRVR
jgi:hypothetical protein